MEKSRSEISDFCAQCGPGGEKPTGVLLVRTPPYINAGGDRVTPPWERHGAMCSRHLEINGAAARTKKEEVKIEPLLP